MLVPFLIRYLVTSTVSGGINFSTGTGATRSGQLKLSSGRATANVGNLILQAESIVAQSGASLGTESSGGVTHTMKQ